ncbi:glutamine and serine-rich protein 1, partial [Protopterus annectens]|uniref:glutamine and serine-rich protein 1 n=1 Tax=Protopterus annectens TaxID=7888 RepID=UPI001CFC22B2
LSTLDPLLQLKTPQNTISAALAFDRIGATALSSNAIPQSSTYRSAQESAPHLLQPQFTLLPSLLGGSQQTSQPYSTAVFLGSAASIERALPRECSVIKHHQRPSSTQSDQTQLTNSQHSLQYLSSANGVAFQGDSKQSELPCSPVGDVTQVGSEESQQKPSEVELDHAQSYSSTVESPDCTSALSSQTNCATKQPQQASETPKSQRESPVVQTQNYAKLAQSQSSVISSQSQIYSVAQLPSLMLLSQSQSYAPSHAQTVPAVTISHVLSSSMPEKLPSLYRPLNSFPGPAQNLAPNNLESGYSDQQALTSVHNGAFTTQSTGLVSVTESQSYSSSSSQDLPTANQTQAAFSCHSETLSGVTPSLSYVSGHPLILTSESVPFSSASHAQSQSSPSSTQSFIPVQSSQNAQSHEVSAQSQTCLPAVQLLFQSPPQSQTQDSHCSSELKYCYVKRKSESNLYAVSKQDDEFPIHSLQALQQQTSLESAQNSSENEVGSQNVIYSAIKTDDRYNSQSVIRSSSRLDEQAVGICLQGVKKDELNATLGTPHAQQTGNMNSTGSSTIHKAHSLLPESHVNIIAKDLKHQEHVVLHTAQETKCQQNHTQIIGTSQSHILRQMQLPTGQVILDPNCEIHLLQQSIMQSALGLPKSHLHQMQSQDRGKQDFLQMDEHIVQTSIGQPPQQIALQNAEGLSMNVSESKALQQHLPAKDTFSSPGDHSSKAHFTPLGSACFSETVLLSDERNVLSNVDDILAATCGVASQAFAKSLSDEREMHSIENTNTSKLPFHQMHIRSVPLSLNSSVVESQHSNNISLNGNPLHLNLSPVASVQTGNSSLDHPNNPNLDQAIPCGLNSLECTPQELEEHNSKNVKQQYSSNVESVDEHSDTPCHGDCNTNDTDFDLRGKGLDGGNTASNDFILGEGDTAEGNTKRGLLKPKTEMGNRVIPDIKTESGEQELTQDGLQKKKVRGKGQTKLALEDENGSQKPLKQGGQAKRQNSRGNDASSPVSAYSADVYDNDQHLESIRQKIKEVEEKQPEVKTGFIASFLDFIKSGPKQQLSPPVVRMANRSKRPCSHIVRPPYYQVGGKPFPLAAGMQPVEGENASPSKQTDDYLKKTMETLPSFCFDDSDSTGKSQILQSSGLPDLDATPQWKSDTGAESGSTISVVTQQSPPVPVMVQELCPTTDFQYQASPEDPCLEHLAFVMQDDIALEGCSDEDDADSGGEGVYKDRDEFVVKTEDIDLLKWSLRTGREPPAIWKVQKALLQKYMPDLRNGHREFVATNSYLGYFGDAKTKYKRIYVKFVETVNKKEYVRICSKKPRTKLSPSLPPLKTPQNKLSNQSTTPDPPAPKSTPPKSTSKTKAKQSRDGAEPPPKKRKKWKEISSQTSVVSSVDAEPLSKKQKKQKDQKEVSSSQLMLCSEPLSSENDPPTKKQKKQKNQKDVSSSPPNSCSESLSSEIEPPAPPSKRQKKIKQLKQLPSSNPIDCPEVQSNENQPPAPTSKRQKKMKKLPSSKPVDYLEAQSNENPNLLELLPPAQPSKRQKKTKQLPASKPADCPEAVSNANQPPAPSKRQKKMKEMPSLISEDYTKTNSNENQTPPKVEKRRKVILSYRPDFCPEAQGDIQKIQSKVQNECQEVTSSLSAFEVQSDEDDEFTPPVPFVSRFQNSRTMRDAFRSYLELLVSAALDGDKLLAVKQDNDKLALPQVNKIDDVLKDNGRRILSQLELDEAFKNALETFPQLTVTSCNTKRKCGDSIFSKISMSGQAYNRKTMEEMMPTATLSQEFTVETEKSHLYTKYHSLRHFKYKLYTICKQKIVSVQQRYKDLGHEEVVKICLKNKLWLDNLFDQLSELLNSVHLKCL